MTHVFTGRARTRTETPVSPTHLWHSSIFLATQQSISESKIIFVSALQIEFNCSPFHFKVDNWPILLYLLLCHCHWSKSPLYRCYLRKLQWVFTPEDLTPRERWKLPEGKFLRERLFGQYSISPGNLVLQVLKQWEKQKRRVFHFYLVYPQRP